MSLSVSSPFADTDLPSFRPSMVMTSRLFVQSLRILWSRSLSSTRAGSAD